jgi:hypothetical protein
MLDSLHLELSRIIEQISLEGCIRCFCFYVFHFRRFCRSFVNAFLSPVAWKYRYFSTCMRNASFLPFRECIVKESIKV